MKASHHIFSSKIDYGNSTLVGLPAYRFEQLQSIFNAAAKIINNKRKHDNVTPLHDLHWLRIRQRINYKFSSLVVKSFLGYAPSYLPFTSTAHVPARLGLRSAIRGSSNHLPDEATLDGRSTDVVGSQIWKTPLSITNTDSAGFHSALKTFLFRESFPPHKF